MRQCIGEDVLFPPILLAVEKEKPFKKFATRCLFVKTLDLNLDFLPIPDPGGQKSTGSATQQFIMGTL
jgi:hypothetical protein